MHELRIAEDLALIVTETAERENLVSVSKVTVSLGQMVQIVPDMFEFAFREAVKETLAGSAELEIELIPVRFRCKGCGREYSLTGDLYLCSECDSPDIEIISGNEMFIKSLEGERNGN